MSIPSHYRQDGVNKNRRKKLKERLKRLIDNSDASSSNKSFLKQNISTLMQEYAELWECRNGREEMQ